MDWLVHLTNNCTVDINKTKRKRDENNNPTMSSFSDILSKTNIHITIFTE